MYRNPEIVAQIDNIPPDTIYSVSCISCGWFGMSDDCHHRYCPNCGQIVKRDKTE